MTKTWECTQCGNTVSKGFIGSLRGAPDTCDRCGNTDFTASTTEGTVHTVLDRYIG